MLPLIQCQGYAMGRISNGAMWLLLNLRKCREFIGLK
jgi:hypothetical protein